MLRPERRNFCTSTAKKEGAELLGKVLKDHDGSILDNLDGFLGNVSAGQGSKILGHVLGRKTSEIEKRVLRGGVLGYRLMTVQEIASAIKAA